MGGSPVIGPDGAGAAPTGPPVQIGGDYNGTVKRIAVDSAGNMKISAVIGSEVQIIGDDGVTLLKIGAGGVVIAAPETGSLYVGGVAVTPKYKVISLSATGTVVAAVPGKKIRVISYVIMASGTVNTKWQSHVAPTDLGGLLYLVANTGAVSGYNPSGHFETVVSEALDLNLSGSVAVGGHLTYVEA